MKPRLLILLEDGSILMLLSTLVNLFQREGDLVMLVIPGLRGEYNGLKSMLVARQFPTTFAELYGHLSDHEYMINKQVPDVSYAQAFTAVNTSRTSTATTPLDAILAVQQLAAQLAIQLQTSPISQSHTQAFYTNRPGNNRGRGQIVRQIDQDITVDEGTTTIAIKEEVIVVNSVGLLTRILFMAHVTGAVLAIFPLNVPTVIPLL
ncbi:hypothetical protein Hanom_Chr12g01154141 [Helianthus anomalus]